MNIAAERMNLPRKEIMNMKYKIVSNCINCGACLLVCPAGAVSKYDLKMHKKKKYKFHALQYFIISGYCNKCAGYSEFPLCIEVCPMDSIKIISE